MRDEEKTKDEIIKELKDLKERFSILESQKNELEKNIDVLQESEKTYMDIFDNVHDMVILVSKYGKILDVNKRVEDVVGYKRDEVIGKNFMKLEAISLKDLPRTIKLFKHAAKTDKVEDKTGKGININEFEIKKKNGEKAYIEASTRVLKKDGKTEGFLSVIRDVTERKHAEEALQENEERYHTIFEQAADSIVLIDAETGEQVEFNKTAHENLGYTYEEFKELKIPDFEVIESAEEVAKHIEKIVREGFDTFETKHRTKGGEIRNILVNSKAISIGGKDFCQSVWRDITDSKRAEEALRSSEETLRRILESSPDAITVTDLEGTIIECNQATLDLHGFSSKDEVIGRNSLDFIAQNDKEKARKNMARTLEKGNVKNIEYTLLTKDGRKFPAELSASVVRDGQSIPKSFVAITKDISDRKRIESEMKKRLMRFDLENGNLYMVKEQTPNLAVEAFNDLLKVGHAGLIISRTPKRNFVGNIDHYFDFLWLSEKGDRGTLSPNRRDIERLIEDKINPVIILFDRLDYLISHNGFKETLAFVQTIREEAYLNDHIIILSLDPSTLDERESIQLEKECMEVKLRSWRVISEDLLEILKYVNEQNLMGFKPTFTNIVKELGISQPTVRKRVRKLQYNGYLREDPKGRTKVIELTEKGKAIFIR